MIRRALGYLNRSALGIGLGAFICLAPVAARANFDSASMPISDAEMAVVHGGQSAGETVVLILDAGYEARNIVLGIEIPGGVLVLAADADWWLVSAIDEHGYTYTEAGVYGTLSTLPYFQHEGQGTFDASGGGTNFETFNLSLSYVDPGMYCGFTGCWCESGDDCDSASCEGGYCVETSEI